MGLDKEEGSVLSVHRHPQKTVTVTQNGQCCVCSYLAFIKEVNGNVLLPQLFYNSAIVPGLW